MHLSSCMLVTRTVFEHSKKINYGKQWKKMPGMSPCIWDYDSVQCTKKLPTRNDGGKKNNYCFWWIQRLWQQHGVITWHFNGYSSSHLRNTYYQPLLTCIMKTTYVNQKWFFKWSIVVLTTSATMCKSANEIWDICRMFKINLAL